LSERTTMGERITEAREASGLSVAQAARRIAVKTRTFRNWESGRTSPRANKLQMLAGILGVPPLWFIEVEQDDDSLPERLSRLDRLELKVERLGALQRELVDLSNEIADEIVAIREIDEELEELAA